MPGFRSRLFSSFVVLLAGLATVPVDAHATDLTQGFTIQGRLLDSDGQTPLQETVGIRFTVSDPDGDCLLYEEQQNGIDLDESLGVFALQVGSATSAGKRTGRDPRLPLKQIFANGSRIRALNDPNCMEGYEPGAGDSRRLRVTVIRQDGSEVVLTPDQSIGAVPQATVAETLAGRPVGDFLLQDGSTVTNQRVLELLNGSDLGEEFHTHDNRYLQSAGGENGNANQNLGAGITYTVQGRIGVGTATPSAQLAILETNPAVPAFVIQRSSSAQTVPVMEIRTEGASPSALLSVMADGNVILHNATPSDPKHLTTKAYVDLQIATREAVLAPGTLAQYYRGDKSWQNLNTAAVPESGANLYFTADRAREAFSAARPLIYDKQSGELRLEGLNGVGLGDQLLGMNATGTSLSYRTLKGTANRITVTPQSNGDIVLSAPQDLAPASSPTFTGVTVNNLEVSQNFKFSASPGNNKVLTSDAVGNARWESLPAGTLGTVTSVTGAVGGPISVANTTTTPVISIQTASGTQSGVLSSTDWNTFDQKQDPLSFSGPLSGPSGGLGGSVSIQKATGSQDGYLSQQDFVAFSIKQPAGNYITSITGDLSTAGYSNGSVVATLANSGVTAGTYAKVTVDAKGRVTQGTVMLSASDLPNASGDVTGPLNLLAVESIRGRSVANVAPTDQQVLSWNATLAQWEPVTFAQSQWQVSGGNLYVLSGNVGLGTAAPTEQLTLTGSLLFPNSTSTAGIIKQGSATLLHTYGNENVFLGKNAGTLATTGTGRNTGIGDSALSTLTTGAENTAVGAASLKDNQSGGANVAVGVKALTATTASQNTAVGAESLMANTTGQGNVGMGYQSLLANQSGSDNVAIGREAGALNQSGSSNVYIGPGAGGSATTESGKLYIANSSSSTLIYGDFTTGRVGLGTTTPTATLQVDGSLRYVDGNQGLNKVLLSDANGNATWGTLPTGGTVTSVSAASPLIVANPNTTPSLTIEIANATKTGAISAADWATFNSKQNQIVSPVSNATDFYYRGDKTWSNLAEDARKAINASGPISYSDTTGTISLLTVGVDRGGTGLTSAGTANQILGVKPDGSGLEYKSVTGTANQVSVTNAAGSLTLALPQNLAQSSSPSFANLTVTSDLTADVVDAINGFTVGGAASADGKYLRSNGTSFVESSIQLGDLPASVLSGTGSSGYLPRYTGSNTVQSSSLYDSSGSIGLGTTSPTRNLQVEGADAIAFLKSTGTSAGNHAMLILETAGTSTNYAQLRMNNDGKSWAIGVDPNDGQKLKFGYNATSSGSNGAGADVNNNTRLTIDSTGKVGVGTTSPAATFHVNGSLKLDLGGAPANGEVLTFDSATGQAKWLALPTPPAQGVTSVTVSGLPLSVANGTTSPTISIAQASGTAAGYLSSADWTTFNNKQPSGSYLTQITGDLTTSAGTPSNGNVVGTLSNSGVTAGTYTKITVDAKGRATSGTQLTHGDVPPPLGDVGGTQGATIVEAIQGRAVSAAAPSTPAVTGDFNVLAWNPSVNGGQWEPKVNRSSQFIPVGANPLGDLYYSTGKLGLGVSSPNEQLEIAGNLRIPATSATEGVIKQGSNRVLHSFGTDNFFAGVLSGNLTLSGSRNTGVGQSALTGLTTGSNNAGVGGLALTANTTGDKNAAFGDGALSSNTTGSKNTGVGSAALSSNLVGGENVGIGNDALKNATGSFNTAVGASSMLTTTSGASNAGLGFETLKALTTGSNNLALGSGAGSALTTGSSNVIIGYQAGSSLTTQSDRFVVANNGSKSLMVGDFAADSGKGRLGVGWGNSTGSVDATLHVAGSLQVDGALKFPQGAGTNKVLTSDAQGNAVWTDVSGVGGVTSVTATAPVVASGTSAVTISMPVATGSGDGYLDNADWTTFNNKEPAVSAGTISQYYRGNKTWSDFNTDARLAVSALAPLKYTNTSGVFELETVTVAKGGTNLTVTGNANQLLGVTNTVGTLEYKTLSGTANQLTVTHSVGGVTLALPQDVASSSNVTFNEVNATAGFKVNNGAAAGTYLRGDGTRYVASTIQQADLPSGSVSGTGTSGRIPKYTASNTLADSLLFETATGVGIGTTSPTTSFQVSRSKTDEAQLLGAILGIATTSTTTNGSHSARGVRAEASTLVDSGRTNSGDATAVFAQSVRAGGGDSGVLADQAAFWGNYGQTDAGAGNTTNSYGLRLTHNRSGGTVTNHYGIRLDTSGSGATVTNNFGLYQTDTNAKNFFGGKVGIGTSNPGSALELGVSGANDGLFIKNGSTAIASLYRSSAGTNPGILELANSGSATIKLDGEGGSNVLSYINNGGKFGVGTATPTSTLHVNGTLRLEQASAGNFKVLASDANGNATWQYFNQLDATTYNATASQTGLLTSADWQTFNSKLTSSLADGKIWVGNAGGQATAVTLSGDATLSNAGVLSLANTAVTAGTYTKVTVDAKGRVTAGTTLAPGDIEAGDVPNAAGDVTGPYTSLTVTQLQGRAVANTPPTQNQILVWNGTNWEPQNNTSSQWSNNSSDIYFNSGRVGIGTIASTNASTKFQVFGGDAYFDHGASAPSEGGALRLSSSTSEALISGNNFWDGTNLKYARNGGAASIGLDISSAGTAGDLAFSTAASGTAGNTLTLSERMRIKQDGKVGIGTTAPAAQLEVRSSSEGLRVGVPSSSYFSFTPKSNADLHLQSSGSGAFMVGSYGATNRTSIASTGALSVDSSGNSSFTGSGNLGVGTSSPSSKLVVLSTSSGEAARMETTQTDGYLSVRNNASKETRLGNDGDGYLSVYDGTTAVRAVTLKQGGNVGIGVSSPAEKLDVGGNIRLSGTQIRRDGNSSDLSIFGGVDSANGASMRLYGDSSTSPGRISLMSKGTGEYLFKNAAIGGGNETELMRLTSTGRLGIGNNNPTEKLDVTGNAKVSGTITANDFVLSGGGSLTGNFVQKSGDTMSGTLTLPANGLVLGTDQLVVAGGNVGIGVASAGAKTEIRSTGEALRLSFNGSNYSSLSAKSNGDLHVQATGSSGSIFLGAYGSSGRMVISGSGAMSIESSADSTIMGSGKLGIGVANPSEKLDVLGNIKTSGDLLAGGNVGVGFGAPSARLHVAAGSNSVPAIKLNSGALTSSPQAGAIEYDGSDLYYSAISGPRRTLAYVSKSDTDYVNVSGDTMTGTLNLPTGGLKVGSSDLVFGTGGNVGSLGIGVSNPTKTLDVSTTNGHTLQFDDGASNTQSSLLVGAASSGRALSFVANSSSSRIVFDEAGDFGIYKDTRTNLNSMNGNSGATVGLVVQGSTGNVGVGTASPSQAFTVVGNKIRLDITGKNTGKFLKATAADGTAEWADAPGGTVTSVSADPATPLSVSNGTGAAVISMGAADTNSDGFLTSANWNAFNSKEPAIAAGTASQYWKGNKAWGNFSTDVRSQISVITPLTYAAGQIGLDTVDVDYGGTGLTAVGAANTLLGTDASGSGLEYKAISGTSNQVSVTNTSGQITLALPQNIHTGATVQFGVVNATTGLRVNGSATNGSFLRGNGTNFVGASIGLSDLPTDVLRNALGSGTSGSFMKYFGGNSAESSSVLTESSSKLAVQGAGSVGFSPVSTLDARAGNVSEPVIRALLKNNESTSGYAMGAYFESNASGSGSASNGAIDAKATRADGGTITTLTGLNLEAGHLSAASGATTNAYGIKILMRRSAGTITNSYGLHLTDSGTATNNFGIYQASSTQTNVFNGKIKVGSTSVNAGDEQFEINGNIAPTTNNTGSVGLSGKRFSAMYTGSLNATGNISADSDVIAASVLPKQADTGTVGTAALPFNNMYSTNGVQTTSDGRLKSRIRDSDLGLEFILGLRPVAYEWKDSSTMGRGTHYGLIAQELEQNVTGRDFAGVIHDEKSDRYSVIYTELIAPLIKAVQELYEQITGHDARIAALEAENARLKAEAQAQSDLLKDLASRVQKLEGRAPASQTRKPASK